MRMSAEAYRRMVGPGPQVTNKYHVAPVEDRTYNGRVYDSRAEMRFAQKLDKWKAAGVVSHWHPQVIFLLPGGVKAVVDFLVFFSDGSWQYIDVKGRRTQQWKRNVRMIRKVHGVEVSEEKIGSQKSERS